MNQIDNIQQQLFETENKFERLPKEKGLTQEHFALWKEIHKLKRNLSLEKGEETAVLLDWKHQWDIGAPMPHIISNRNKTFLIYYLADPDPNWDGTYVSVANTSSTQDKLIAKVEFIGLVNYKFGNPNDEVIEGHPLFEHGLETHRAHEIINSKWITEIEKINSVHTCYNPETWKKLRHFIFTFHDDIFECIVKDYNVKLHKGRFKDIVFEATEELFK